MLPDTTAALQGDGENDGADHREPVEDGGIDEAALERELEGLADAADGESKLQQAVSIRVETDRDKRERERERERKQQGEREGERARDRGLHTCSFSCRCHLYMSPSVFC